MTKTHLLLILILKTLLVGIYIWLSPVGLGPDEAQYWTWSQKLDWGYYSKPPGIAWEIWAGSSLFGNTEFGVRFGALVLGFILPLVVYFLGKRVTNSEQIGVWAALGLALSPLGFFSSFLAITDTGMALFWALASLAMIRKQPPNYLLVGLFIALGALFKWPIYALWAVIAAVLLFYPAIRSKHVLGGFLVSLLGLLPSLYWNMHHDWATVRHVWATIIGQQVTQGVATIPVQPNFWEFLVAQLALMSPLLFIFFICGCVYGIKNRKNLGFELQFLIVSSLTLLVLCLTLALFKKIQGNWISYIYTSAFVVSAWFCFYVWKPGRLLYPIGVIIGLMMSILLFALPWTPLPFRINPFKHNMGWDELKNALDKQGYNPQNEFLLGDKYQMTSILSFYSSDQKRAYFFNLLGTRRNQFSYWPSLEEQEGKSGYFVAIETSPNLDQKLDKQIEFYNQILKGYFGKVSLAATAPLVMVGNSVEKVALIYKISDFNGRKPIENQLY